ncbi:MBOAT family protein, partial [Candidatus Microgenomates bacterium]|nr:MBOAT family protein [Candidatus Microgenomates bacterium]
IVLILVDYFAAHFIEKSKNQKRKIFLLMSILANVGILCFFKYFNFFFDSIAHALGIFNLNPNLPHLSIILPLGLSFHVFQSMSYTIEVYKKKFKAEKHLGIYALYVMFYPQLVAGPIERPYSLLPQFYEKHNFEASRVFNGLKIMLWGFFKKVVIADRLALLVNPVFSSVGSYSGFTLLLATYAFTFQILCDFAGYSDIAIGASQVMGFNLRDNFNRPYLSSSITEFWNRWHMSLSNWFRDYVYIPLGGNRVSKLKWYRNIMIVFLISGLWHGADWKFVIWGGVHGLYVILESIIKPLRDKIGKIVSILVTFNLVSFAWIFFRANTVKDAFQVINKIFAYLINFKGTILLDNYVLQNKENFIIVFLLICFVGFIYLIEKHENMRKMFAGKPIMFRWSIYYLLLLMIIFFGVFNQTKFIYFQF